MACLILTSCTTGNTTVLATQPSVSPGLIPYIGQHVSVIGHPGVCFYVEQIDSTCIDCTKNPTILPITGNPLCQCTVPFVAYILTPCEGSALPTLYSTQNLYSFVGTSITFLGQGEACYSVAGSLVMPTQLQPVIVECPTACTCEPVVCGCPEGFVLNLNNECEGIISVPPIDNGTLYGVIQAQWDEGNFGIYPAEFYEDITTKPWPILSSAPALVSIYSDNTLVPLLITNTISNPVWGGFTSSGSYRMRIAAVWTDAPPIGINQQPMNEWIGFSYCFTLTETKTYYVAYAVDDFARIFLDGTLMINQDVTGWAFRKLQIFPITLTAGQHTLTGEVKTTGASAMFAFEIYDATLAQLLAVSTPGSIDPYVVFSTAEQVGFDWQTGETSGYACPDGYSLNLCDGVTCTQITTVPQIPCLAWEITFCEGTNLSPIITNTNLTQYIGGVYSVTYTSGQNTITACCTVAQAPSQTAPIFNGTFSQIIYDCCEACMATCYLLEDCQNAVPDMILCTDLSQYVGKIIKIKGCGNICWQVSESNTCVGSINFDGEVTEFDTCELCLPPVPVPAPLELNLRKVKPGYNSPNSCVTLEYLQRVNCNFALQVYNEMLIKRYGITVCCDQDVDTWDIQKSELDYMLMGDPGMCKSTLCDCKAPCLIDVTFTLVPTCVAPILIDATFDNLCNPPTLVDVEIVVEIPCYCYVLIGANYTVEWIDCCCKTQSTTFTSNATICAQALPIIIEGTATVTLADTCGSELCVAPPPVCNCWLVTPGKTGILSLSYNACDGTPIVINNLEYGSVIELCSSTSPVIDGEGVVNINGFCNLDCGLVPNANCLCYILNVTSTDASVADATIKTLDCTTNTVITTNLNSISGPLYICSRIAPRITAGSANAEVNITVNYSLDCSLGECVAP